MLTFIIPTLNRPTLLRTLTSLQHQTNSDWKAIVVADGCEINPEFKITDERIRYIQREKRMGIKNHAGEVRNEGINLVDTEWVGFVDDDDVLSPKYVENFKKELHLFPDVDCIIFRMLMTDRRAIFPHVGADKILISHVGISFCYKMRLGVKFEPSYAEDFFLLEKMRRMGSKILISKYLNYIVRDDYRPEFEQIESLTSSVIVNNEYEIDSLICPICNVSHYECCPKCGYP